MNGKELLDGFCTRGYSFLKARLIHLNDKKEEEGEELEKVRRSQDESG